MKLLSALGHRSFAWLWMGQTISRVGDFTYQIAVAWWVLQQTGSAAAMGMVMIFAFAPMLLFLLIGGAAVNRYSRVRIMLASDLGRGVLTLGLAVLAATGHLRLWEVYTASLVFGFVDAFFNPAYAAAVPQLVPADELPSANGLSSLSVQFGRIVGPPIGAVIIAWGGPTWAFAVDGLSFFASAACLMPLLSAKAPSRRVNLPDPEATKAVGAVQSPLLEPSAGPPQSESSLPTQPKPSSIFSDVREGIRFVLAKPWLWVTITMFTLVNVLLAGPYTISLPFLVTSRLTGGVWQLGLLYAMFPIGYAAAAILLGRMDRLRRRGPLIFGGAVVAGLAIALFGTPVHLALIAVAAIVNGFALEMASLAWTNTMQIEVPADMLGRVTSIDSLGSYALLPIGYALAGWATDRYGAPAVFIAGGGCSAIIALVGLLHPAIRKLD